MSSFVYNDGNFELKKEGELDATFGLFFDGTTNNRYHTEIRKKIEKKGEFANYEITSDDKIKETYDKYGHNDSFGNDFTNVARFWYCCERKKYAIYVEGIGTVGKDVEDKDDVGEGYTYGRGITGIIAKVKAGCNELAEKIKTEYDEKIRKKDTDEEITKINLIIDAFGFSRGAAAARHFLYNLQMKAYEPESYSIQTYNTYGYRPKPCKIDYAGFPIHDSWLKDGKLPRYGYLGVALLQAGITHELIETMDVTVRFLGIYDTVASFDPKCFLVPDFKKYIDELHLHELGKPKRAVHYTAADEHRKNFSLTRLKIGYEFNLPGAHSDVGGSYDHDKLSSEKFAEKQKDAKLTLRKKPTSKASEYEIVHLSHEYLLENFYLLRAKLIKQGWFYPDEIIIKYIHVLIGGHLSTIRYLYAERILNRGFSFIPLQFMCDEAESLLNEVLFKNRLFTNYALEDEFLEKVKAYLQEQVIEKTKAEKDLEKRKEIKWELKDPERTHHDAGNALTSGEEEVEPDFELGEVEVVAYPSDFMLRKLRNQYLHWSAKLNTFTDKFAHAPAKNRIRDKF